MLRPAIWLPQLALDAGSGLAASTAAPTLASLRQPQECYPALLLGKWQSIQDPRSMLRVTRTTC